jgi:transcriptional regulator with XRE-family HTH domain
MKDRILEFLKKENKSSAQFAEEIGVQASSISHIISGRNNPSLDFVMKMLNKYPAVSTDWLLFGKGEMYRESLLNDLFNNSFNETDIEIKKPTDKDLKDNSKLENNHQVTDNDIFNENETHSNSKKARRIICFYSDNTFKEYFPEEK